MSTGELNIDDLEGLVGRELDGRYLLEQFIDRGGFGVVYRGIDKKFNSPVAVKVGLSYREFMKEAKLAAEVKHDNIVQVSDYGNDHGLAYLVMEFLQGDDLEKLFKDQGNRLTVEQLRKLVSEVGDALSHAHSDQLIHRDLKPRNIILKATRGRTTSQAARFVLLDFGIAAKLDAKGTQRNRTQDGAGTVEYMAPELLRTSPVATQLSDIYAFGVILYQMMTGRVPFQQCDNSHMALAECLNAIAHQPPPRFSEIAPDRKYPSAAEAVVMQCLEKDPARRPQTMGEVRDRFLHAFPIEQPVSVRPRETTQTLRPGELDDTAPNPDVRSDSWNSNRIPQETPSTRWPWIVLALGLMVALVFGVARPYFGTPDLSSTAALTLLNGTESSPIDEATPVQIVAGDRLLVAFELQDLPRGATPQFTDPEAPKGVVIKEEAATSLSRTYSVSVVDPNTAPETKIDISFQAIAPGLAAPLEKKLPMQVARPEAWLSDSLRKLGFRPASDSRFCRVGNAVYATVLERPVGGEAVRLMLVPGTEINERVVRTFYVTERLVTKAQFQAFATAEPDYQLAARAADDRKWQDGSEGPVTDVYVLEAQRYARWFAGPAGTLPSAAEWELAAGYHLFRHLLEQRLMQPVRDVPPQALLEVTRMRHTHPLLGADVWVGKGPTLGEFHPPGGTGCKGCSPFGLKFEPLKSGMPPAEMTSTLVSFTSAESDLRSLGGGQVPRGDDKSLRDGLFSARLRGFSADGQAQEEMWVKPVTGGQAVRTAQDLDAAGTLVLLPELGIGFDSYIGFRVAVSTEGSETSTVGNQSFANDYFVRN